MLQADITLFNKRLQHFLSRLDEEIYTASIPMEASYSVKSGEYEFSDLSIFDLKQIRAGQAWGKLWDTAFFRLQASIPDSWKSSTVCALINIDSESMIIDEKDGTPLYSLTGNSYFAEHYKKLRFVIVNQCAGSKKIRLLLKAMAAKISFKGDREYIPEDPRLFDVPMALFHSAHIAKFRDDI